MNNNLPEVRRKKLKQALKNKKHLRVLEASNGLTGIIVENTKVGDKEFDAMWLSSLCDSTIKGKPDNESVDFSSKVRTIEEILEVTSKPIIVDGDTGGKTEHFIYNIRTLERLGVSAVIVEDKKGLKHNSLLENSEQTLEDKEIFAEKIRQGKSSLQSDDFMIIARLESFIAGKDINDALDRAEAYINAGADGIMIHSKKEDGKEILDFIAEFKNRYTNIPLVLVPTTYNHFKDTQLFNLGADIVIYANQLLRSSYKIMNIVAEKILQDESSEGVSKNYCASLEEILQITGDCK